MSALSSADRPAIAIRAFARLEKIDEKEVRRGLETGRLQGNARGRPFADQAGNGWHRPRRDSVKFAADIGENVRIAADIADPAEIVEQADAFVADVLAGRYRNVVEAVQIKENALALVRVLEARQRADSLVDKAAVLDATFRRARGERDAWLNWTGRVAPLVAADLGVEPERVAEVLAAHVHQQLVDLGEPELDLDGASP